MKKRKWRVQKKQKQWGKSLSASTKWQCAIWAASHIGILYQWALPSSVQVNAVSWRHCECLVLFIISIFVPCFVVVILAFASVCCVTVFAAHSYLYLFFKSLPACIRADVLLICLCFCFCFVFFPPFVALCFSSLSVRLHNSSSAKEKKGSLWRTNWTVYSDPVHFPRHTSSTFLSLKQQRPAAWHI